MKLTIEKSPKQSLPFRRSYAELWKMLRETEEWISLPAGDVSGGDAHTKVATLRGSARSQGFPLTAIAVRDGLIFIRRVQREPLTLNIGPGDGTVEGVVDLVVGPVPATLPPFRRCYIALWKLLKETDQWISMPGDQVPGLDARTKVGNLRRNAHGVGLIVEIVAEDDRLYIRRKLELSLSLGIEPKKQGRLAEPAPPPPPPPQPAPQPPRAIPDARVALRSPGFVPDVLGGTSRDLRALREQLDEVLDNLYTCDDDEVQGLNLGLDKLKWGTYKGEVYVAARQRYPECRLIWEQDGSWLYVKLEPRQSEAA